MGVTEVARQAYQSVESKRDAEKQRKQQQEARAASSARTRRIKKHRHLLDESGLPEWFPGVEWSCLDAQDSGPGDVPTLWVKEKGGSEYDPKFRVNANGVFIDYHRDVESIGQWRSEPSVWRVTSAYDVGAYIDFKHEQMSAAYRRNPD